MQIRDDPADLVRHPRHLRGLLVEHGQRFEQVLIYQGVLTSDALEAARREIGEFREQGRLVKLEDHLIELGYCSAEAIEKAHALSGGKPDADEVVKSVLV